MATAQRSIVGRALVYTVFALVVAYVLIAIIGGIAINLYGEPPGESEGGEMSLRALGVDGSFDVEIYGDEVDRAKPDPEPVLRALAELGLDTSERIAFVGDAIHDVEAGRAAGVYTIAVTWGAGGREELEAADAVVDDGAALSRLLLG